MESNIYIEQIIFPLVNTTPYDTDVVSAIDYILQQDIYDVLHFLNNSRLFAWDSPVTKRDVIQCVNRWTNATQQDIDNANEFLVEIDKKRQEKNQDCLVQ